MQTLAIHNWTETQAGYKTLAEKKQQNISIYEYCIMNLKRHSISTHTCLAASSMDNNMYIWNAIRNT